MALLQDKVAIITGAVPCLHRLASMRLGIKRLGYAWVSLVSTTTFTFTSYPALKQSIEVMISLADAVASVVMMTI